MKATYTVAAKPFKAVGMAALSTTVAAVKNNEHFKERQRKKQEEERETLEEEAQERLDNDEELNRKDAELEALEAKKKTLEVERKNLLKEQQDLTDQQYLDYVERRDDDLQVTNRALDKNQKEIDVNKKETEEVENEIKEKKKEIKNREDELEKEFLTERISSGAPILGTVKGNLGAAFNALVEEREGRFGGRKKFRSRKVETVREGGLNKAFWRKKVSSKSLTFKNNMKLGKLFGLDSSEEKILKSEMNFWKDRITALGSMVAGFPALVTNPLAGMALLSKAGITHLDVKTRRRRYKNRAAQIKNKTYTFKGFGPGAAARLSRPESYHILEMDQLETLKHKKVRKEVKNVMNWAKDQEKRKGSIESKVETLKNKYTENMYHYERAVKKDTETKSTESIAFEQKVRENNVVNVGDGVCMQLNNNVAMKKFMDKIEEIDTKPHLSQAAKIDMIRKEMDKQKGVIIKEAITSLCAEKGITDIVDVQLTDVEMVQINQNILGMIEEKGIVKKGEIDLEGANINEETISKVYLDLTSKQEATNKQLESNLVSSAILEYMEKKGEKNISNLNTDEAKEEIYDMVKDKLMPTSSKKSAVVIEKLLGKDKLKEEFELPEDVKISVEENIKKVKKIRKRRFIKRS